MKKKVKKRYINVNLWWQHLQGGIDNIKCYVKTILDLLCQYVPQNLFFQSKYLLDNHMCMSKEIIKIHRKKFLMMFSSSHGKENGGIAHIYIHIYISLSISHLMPSIAFTSNQNIL